MNQRAILCSFLAAALALPAPGWGQQVSGPKQNVVPESGGLKIAVIQGEGASNDVRTKAVTPPIVEVRDDAGKPVAAAEVVFTLPAAGAGGIFYGWMRTQTLRSDASGRATPAGYRPNDEEGKFQIEVSASAGGKRGAVYITQINRAGGANAAGVKSGKSHKTLWVVLGVLAVGGIAGGVAATRGGSSTAAVAPIPVTISTGPVTVAGPR